MGAQEMTMARQLQVLVLVLVLGIAGVSPAALAQDPTIPPQPAPPLDQPPTPEGYSPPVVSEVALVAFPETMDMRAVCENIQRDGLNAPATSLLPNTNLELGLLSDGDGVGRAQLALMPAAMATVIGYEAYVEATEGPVVVFTCNQPMIFDVTQGDQTNFQLPPGTGMILDSQQGLSAIFLLLAETQDFVWINNWGNGALASVLVEVEFGDDDRVLCDSEGCWMVDQFTAPMQEPATSSGDDGTTTGGGGCGRVRCWGS